MKGKRQPVKNSARSMGRVLVPTDFSKAARRALDHAVTWTAGGGGRISLLYVEPTPVPADMTQLPVLLEHEQHLRKAEGWLSELRKRALAPGRRGTMEVRKGSVYYEIIKAAQEQRADLIVMGTHGYSGLSHALLGSVAERVVRHAPMPVLTVRESSRRGRPGVPRRILVPVDFSEPTVEALKWATDLAGRFEARIRLIHVLEPPNYPVFGYAHVPLQERRWRLAAAARLEEVSSRLDSKVLDGFHIRTGRAFQEIVEEAKRWKAGLVVIATHGHTGLAHMLLGSTAERVVRHAGCPVLTVRKG